MSDPVARLALARAASDAAEIEAQLFITDGARPIALLLRKAKAEAADAMASLLAVDPAETNKIRELQFEVRRYADLYRWISDVIHEGHEAGELLGEDDREEMIEILRDTPEGRQHLINLGLMGEDDAPSTE
jgi:hypothetical protein